MRFAKRLIKPLFGRRSTQRFFEWLRKAALMGLHIGQGGRVEDSGEEAVLSLVKKEMGPKRARIFDVGANKGDWSLRALSSFGFKSEIFAFEPSLQTFEKLKQNLPAGAIEIFNFGFGNREGKASLFSDSPISGIASLYPRKLDHFNVELGIEEAVFIRTLDAFCEERQIDSIDFLKLDVEGHELAVLEGAKNLLEKGAIRYIQFEFGGSNIDSRTYFQDFFYLLHEKYHLFRVVRNGLYPILSYREIDECFITTNYFAKRKGL